METPQIIDVFRDAVGVAVRLSGPMLLLCMLVGVLIAILQAVTQIHEQSIAFVLKLIVVVLFLSLGGSWMLNTLHDYALRLFSLMV